MAIDVAIPPGTLVNASGANAGGPLTAVGSTLSITKGFGVAK